MFMRAVHPGEVLKGELEELGITPTEFARQIDVPPQPGYPDHRWQAFGHRRHRATLRSLVRQRSSVLAQPSGPVRLGSGRQGRRCLASGKNNVYSTRCRFAPKDPTISLRSKMPTTPAWPSPMKRP